MPAILDSLEKILARIVEQPLSQTLAELQRFAGSEPRNPGPSLAMAMVLSFGRYDFKEASRHLEIAGRLLRNVDVGGDPEMAFAQALFNAMSAEFKVFTLVRPIQGQITPIQLKAHVEAGKESQAAIADMGNIVRRLSGSTLAQTIHAALLAFARANSVGGPEYSRGLSALSRLQRNSASPDLAAFFLFYVYRRSRDYRQAIRIGQALEKRQPNSSLVKTALGSCYFYMHDFNRAEQFYRQALALAPQDPSVRLELARVLEHRGDIAGARQLATQAAAADREGHLASFVKEFNQVLETRELHQQFRGD